MSVTFLVEGFSQKYLLEQDVNKDTLIPKVGLNRKFHYSTYTGLGFIVGPYTNAPPSKINYGNSWQFRSGTWYRLKLSRYYAIGGYIEYARDAYILKSSIFNDSVPNSKVKWHKQVNNNYALGLFNRIIINGDKVFLDIGGYYAYDVYPRIKSKFETKDVIFGRKRTTITHTAPPIMNRHHYGLDARFSKGHLGLYAKYRISGLYKNKNYDLPKLVIGVLIDLKD